MYHDIACVNGYIELLCRMLCMNAHAETSTGLCIHVCAHKHIHTSNDSHWMFNFPCSILILKLRVKIDWIEINRG